jgi:hypothetical protein
LKQASNELRGSPPRWKQSSTIAAQAEITASRSRLRLGVRMTLPERATTVRPCASFG